MSNELLKEFAKHKKKKDQGDKTKLFTRLTSNLQKSNKEGGEEKMMRVSSSGTERRGNKAPTKSAEKPSNPIFGSPLEEVMARDPSAKVPRVIQDGIAYMYRKGLKDEGIFRLSGAKGDVDSLKAAYDYGEDVDLQAIKDPNVIASLLKLYLRELPEPLLPAKDYDAYIAAVQLGDDEQVVAKLTELMENVPKINKNVLNMFCRMLSCVTMNEKFNKMSPANCSIILGPNILRKKIDATDFRQSAALAMDSGDVNKVAEFLIVHPGIIKMEDEDQNPVASFETKLMAHNKSCISLVELGSSLMSLDSGGSGNLWDPQKMKHVKSFEIGWRPLGAESGNNKVRKQYLSR